MKAPSADWVGARTGGDNVGRLHSRGEAASWGMIWRCVPDAQLLADSMGLAQRLAAGPPEICREVRLAYHAAQLNDVPAQMDYERLRQRELLDRPSFSEGLKAFQEKRTPNFCKPAQ